MNKNVNIIEFSSLFRFRQINNYTLSALENNEIWGASPTTFNDPYDTIMCYDREIVVEYLYKMFKNMFPILNNTQMYDIILKAIIYMEENFNSSKFVYTIACFTESITREIMWSHYANNGKGFALEYNVDALTAELYSRRELEVLEMYKDYDLRGLLKYDSEFVNKMSNAYVLSKVDYVDEKYDATSGVLKGIDSYKEFADGIDLYKIKKLVDKIEGFDSIKKSLTSKNLSWEYEREWRFFTVNNMFEQGVYHRCLGRVKPKAIYFGEFISDDDLVLLLNKIDWNKIDCYKMYTDIGCKQNMLKYVELSEEYIKNKVLGSNKNSI